MCATCGSPIYGQDDAKQLAAIKADKEKLDRVQRNREAKLNAKKKNKQVKRINS